MAPAGAAMRTGKKSALHTANGEMRNQLLPAATVGAAPGSLGHDANPREGPVGTSED